MNGGLFSALESIISVSQYNIYLFGTNYFYMMGGLAYIFNSLEFLIHIIFLSAVGLIWDLQEGRRCWQLFDDLTQLNKLGVSVRIEEGRFSWDMTCKIERKRSCTAFLSRMIGLSILKFIVHLIKCIVL